MAKVHDHAMRGERERREGRRSAEMIWKEKRNATHGTREG